MEVGTASVLKVNSHIVREVHEESGSSVISSNPYICLVKDAVCLCGGPYYNESDDSESFLALLSICFDLLLLFLPIIIFFNCNLASGPNHSFVFFYQCAPLATVVGSLTVYLVMQNFFFQTNPDSFSLNILSTSLYYLSSFLRFSWSSALHVHFRGVVFHGLR